MPVLSEPQRRRHQRFRDVDASMRRHEIERIGLARLSGVMDETACLTGMTDVYDASSMRP